MTSIRVFWFSVLLLPAVSLCAADRTADEFRAYVQRRIHVEDATVLAEFVARVDQDNNGVISDAEFAARIDVYQDVFQSVRPVARRTGHALPDNWLTDFEKAQLQAKESGKPVVAMFSASWCGPCRMMIANVYPADKVRKSLQEFVPVYIDSEKDRELATKHDIRAFPTFICFDADGQPVDQHVGGGDQDDFIAMLSTFRDALAATDAE